jgi:SNF2 family DNA or RNA helicase
LLQNFSTFSDLAPAHLVEDAVEPLVRLYEDMLADGALNLENTGAVSDMLDEFPEMGFHASQALNTIREAFDAILDENLQMIANGGVLVGKLQEIANGFLYNGQPKKGFDLVHEQKLDALDELISSLHGSPLLVAYKFNAEFELLQERFPAPHLGSGINAKQAAETERAWNNSELPLMYVHPASAGHGLNLQYGTCQTICWYAMTWSLEEYDQLTARIRRRGQTASQIRAHHLVCNDTVDEDLLQAVADKADVESAVQGGIRMRNLKRK